MNFILILSVILFSNLSFTKEVRKPNQTEISPKELGYKINGSCDGYPRIDVSTAKGFCVGLVYSGKGLTFPRGILQIANDKILIVDMGGWDPNKGKLHLLEKENAYNWKLKTLLKTVRLNNSWVNS